MKQRVRTGGGSDRDPGARVGGARGFEEAQLEADGFEIRYLTAGTGTPVVYFHGGGCLHISPALELLAGHLQVTAFEFPGFGHLADVAHSLPRDIASVAEVEDQLALRQAT